jgi:hypothetical protein
VTADDGRIFVGDCGSASGTWRRTEKDGASVWLALRQDFVRSGDTLRLGDHECVVADLLSAASPEGEAASHGPGKTPLHPAGRLSRDPWTGEIVRRGR